MQISRLQQLLEFYQDEKNDPFIMYGIALEYLKLDRNEAEHWFTKILNEFPSYFPVYYHAGKFYEEGENPEKALEIYKSGIELCKTLNEAHALKELQTAYNNLLFELE